MTDLNTRPINGPNSDLLDPSTGEIAPLPEQEQQELERCEKVIEAGLDAFIEVGSALMTIHDKRLYRRDYDTFAEYCGVRWNMTRQHAYRLIEAVSVAGDVSPTGLQIANERQARALARLATPLERQAATLIAYSAAEQTNGKISASMLEKAVDTVEEMRVTGGKVDLGDGKMTAATASVLLKHHEAIQSHIDQSQQGKPPVTYVTKKAKGRIVSVTDNGQVILQFDNPALARNIKSLWLARGTNGLLITILKEHATEGK